MQKGKEEGKYVLVNIQKKEEFLSHILNRDVWRDDFVDSLVRASFIFWQKDDKSAQGEQFLGYYKDFTPLPHIGVIDPRTNRAMKRWPGEKFKNPMHAAEHLTNFVDRFQFVGSSVSSSCDGPRPSTSEAPGSTAGSMNIMAPGGTRPLDLGVGIEREQHPSKYHISTFLKFQTPLILRELPIRADHHNCACRVSLSCSRYIG